MSSLGSLGKTRPQRQDTFDWFGTRIRVNPEISDGTLMDFMERAAQVEAVVLDDLDVAPRSAAMLEQMTFMKTALREFIHPDDFDTYWRVGRENRQQTEDHMEVVTVLVAAAAERPTSRSSASSAGSATSEDELTAASLRRATAGRPDLEVGLMTEWDRRRQMEAAQAS